MQPRHRRDKTQSQTAARLRPALFQPDKAFEHALAIGRRNARSAIGDGDLDDIAFLHRGHFDIRLLAGFCAASLRRSILDRVVDEIGDGLAEQLPVGADEDRTFGVGLEHETALLRDWLVKLGHVAKKRGDVESFAVFAPRARLDAGDGEKCVEGLDQAIGLLDGSLERLAIDRLAIRLAKRGLDAVAQAIERRLEIVGDIVRDLAHGCHELLDPREHEIEAFGQAVELVAGAGDG
jgi:hypothetical protein